MVWACDAKKGTHVGRRAMVMKVPGKGREEDIREDGWTKKRMISKRRDCRLMMCTTVLHGGVCHCTSTPHKSGNNMKKK